jgi:2-oxoisovalerate dehydrogenase E1 component beta subunit
MTIVSENITLVDAVNMALRHEMARDHRIILLGEDIGANGGVFRATDGLQKQFGADRVIDTPLAEAGIAGVAVGMAAQGLIPVAEIQFMGFLYPALDQLANHAARLRSRTRGRLSCPLVIRVPFGGGIHAPEHHSESIEAMLCHMPGLRVVTPSSPQAAYGLLLAAIRDPDPVVFMEPKRNYRSIQQDVIDDGIPWPLDCAITRRDGDDVTLISWGAMMVETLDAAERLAAQNIHCHVIDVATLAPLDMDCILASVEKTGRCVIVHEAAKNGGLGAEISARIGEQALYHLRGPVVRVAGPDCIMPLARMEHLYMPQTAQIISSVQDCMAQ